MQMLTATTVDLAALLLVACPAHNALLPTTKATDTEANSEAVHLLVREANSEAVHLLVREANSEAVRSPVSGGTPPSPRLTRRF